MKQFTIHSIADRRGKKQDKGASSMQGGQELQADIHSENAIQADAEAVAENEAEEVKPKLDTFALKARQSY